MILKIYNIVIDGNIRIHMLNQGEKYFIAEKKYSIKSAKWLNF